MCGVLSSQTVLSGQLSARNFLVRPPEPSPEMLVSSPLESVYIGKTQFLRAPFFWNPKKLVNPHLCVVGISGSGKSYFVKTFITRASLVLGASALILDWAGEYAEWVLLAGGRVVDFGESGVNLLGLGGASPHNRASQVLEALQILTDISSFPKQLRLTEEAIEQAYLQKGFALQKESPGSSKKKPPTLENVLAILKRKSRGGADSEAAEAARRIRNLLLSSGKSFCAQSISTESLLSGLVCVDLHSLPTESLRSLAGLAILQFVKERMRRQAHAQGPKPRLFVVVDEAWKIASDGRSDVVSIVREGRKYGFGLVVASQNPTDVHKAIFSSAGTVLCFRLTLSSEREYVRSSLSYSGFLERQSHFLSVGQALVHLEFSQQETCPRDFLLQKVDGEGMLEVLSLKGGGMDLEFERGALSRKLLSLGLSDKQVSSLLLEFEQRNYSLEAGEFVLALEKFGHGRASAISMLRELGAGEKQLLQLFSEMDKVKAEDGSGEMLLRLDASAQQGREPAWRAKGKRQRSRQTARTGTKKAGRRAKGKR